MKLVAASAGALDAGAGADSAATPEEGGAGSTGAASTGAGAETVAAGGASGAVVAAEARPRRGAKERRATGALDGVDSDGESSEDADATISGAAGATGAASPGGAAVGAAARLAIRRIGRDDAEVSVPVPSLGGVGATTEVDGATGASARAAFETRLTRAGLGAGGATSATTGASGAMVAVAAGLRDRRVVAGEVGSGAGEAARVTDGDSEEGVKSVVCAAALVARARVGRFTATSSSPTSRAFVIPYPLHPFHRGLPPPAYRHEAPAKPRGYHGDICAPIISCLCSSLEGLSGPDLPDVPAAPLIQCRQYPRRKATRRRAPPRQNRS